MLIRVVLGVAGVAIRTFYQYFPSVFLQCYGLNMAYCSGRELGLYMEIVPVGLLLKIANEASEMQMLSNAADNILYFAKVSRRV